MDNNGSLNWDESTLINELNQGKENAYKLKFHLLSTSPNEVHDLLLQRIVSSYDKSLTMVLKRYGYLDRIRTGSTEPSWVAPANGYSITLNEELNEGNMSFKGFSQENNSTTRKRKLMPSWTQRVKVSNGAAGPTDDGCSWRKYGQKDILGAKYPRSYYRCTYKFLQNCTASKQIQRTDENPAVFEITYKGTHSCSQSNHNASVPRQPLPYSSEAKGSNNNVIPVHFSFPGQDRAEPCYSPILASSATSESDHYNLTGFDFCRSGISDNSEIASTTTNSPVAGIGFDPDMLFDNMGFYFSLNEQAI